jgi:UDP-N-acetylmuramoyl-L-alanyl-D-glutamate--2,6-diaminopimelate ligase
LSNIDFDVAVFTNLTRDHLDFHTGFEEYFCAKRRLFEILGASSKSARSGIVNIDDSYGRRLFNGKNIFPYPVFSYGVDNDADYMPVGESVRNTMEGISYSMKKPEPGALISLSVAGSFNVYNSLCAAAAAHRLNIPFKTISEGLSEVTTVPGRFDLIVSDGGYYVIVDYAHTDDALQKLLQSVNELGPKRVITIFGCGGNRDRGKRPLMGRIAVLNSDHVIVTNDNPRNEKSGDIIHDILAGIETENYEVIEDRNEAIKKAVNMAEAGDVVVIAGKGHEDYQIIGDKKTHFDDRETAKFYIHERIS